MLKIMITLFLNVCLSTLLFSQDGSYFNSNTNSIDANRINNNKMDNLASQLIVLIGNELISMNSSEFKNIDKKDIASIKNFSGTIMSTYLHSFDCFDVADLFFERSEAREIIINCSSIVAHIGGMEHIISSAIQYFLENSE